MKQKKTNKENTWKNVLCLLTKHTQVVLLVFSTHGARNRALEFPTQKRWKIVKSMLNPFFI
jgi:hypothetical protein